MKLVTFMRPEGTAGVGAVVGDQVVELTDVVGRCAEMRAEEERVAEWLMHIPERSMLRLLAGGPAALKWVADTMKHGLQGRRTFWMDQIRLLAPIPRPGKIVGVGKNYADHRAETGGAAVEQPTLFFKAATTVVGPGAAVVHPSTIQKMDYEGELAVVIGDFASHVRRENALDVVAGYTILNDLSAREFQHDRTPRQTSLAKSIDGFCPMGPWIVTKDEVPCPQALDLKLYLNGEEMQHGSTSDMIFPVDAIIEYITRYVTLEPGDIIATGTPAGIGAFRKPPVWLKRGDHIKIEVSRIGNLEHTIV